MIPAGRKRHIIVDMEGRMIGTIVYEANVQDRDGTKVGSAAFESKMSPVEADLGR
jgi:hypothetical protein